MITSFEINVKHCHSTPGDHCSLHTIVPLPYSPGKCQKDFGIFFFFTCIKSELTNNSGKMILHEITKQKGGADDRRQIIKRKIFSPNSSSHRDIKRKCLSLLLQCRQLTEFPAANQSRRTKTET